MTDLVTIAALKPGTEFPTGAVNSRKAYTDDEVTGLLNSILSFGVLQSLLVCSAPEVQGPPYYVVAGGRRLAAIQKGIKTKKLTPDFPIPVIIAQGLDHATALAASIEENDERIAPHPADAYEQFAVLRERGKTNEDISKLFRIDVEGVRRILALGSLSPKVRKAWREGVLHDADAKAFTLAADHAQQDKVFDRLKKSHNLYSGGIRQAIVGDSHGADKFLKFIGKDAYEKAGGKLQENLFSTDKSDDVIVLDFPLLVRLTGEKMEAACKELTDDGWSWAVDQDDIKNFYSMNRAPKADAKSPKAVKAKTGCAVNVNQDGKLVITYGLMKSGTHAARQGSKKTGKGGGVKPPSNTVSISLSRDLTMMKESAIRDALINGKPDVNHALQLARIVSKLIVPGGHIPEAVREKLSALRDGITPKVMTDALQARFDAKRYFTAAPRVLVEKAITEALGAKEAAKLSKGPKHALATFAEKNVPKTGWLPPELRPAHYAKAKAKA